MSNLSLVCGRKRDLKSVREVRIQREMCLMLPADCFIFHLSDLSDYSKYDISASELKHENRYLALQMSWHLISFFLVCAATFCESTE